MTTRSASTSAPTSKRTIAIAAGLLVGAVLIALVVALTSGGSDDGDATVITSSRIPQGEVDQVSFAEVNDAALPRFDSTVVDPALGMLAPAFTASYFDNTETTVTPGDGTARVVLFLAHWCPHCQAEVTALTEWFGSNEVPVGVEVVAVSTSVDQGAPNYSPSAWFLREGWPLPVLRDSDAGDLAAGYGLSGFPYLVAIDSDGNVVRRSTGQLPEGQWQVILDSLAG